MPGYPNRHAIQAVYDPDDFPETPGRQSWLTSSDQGGNMNNTDLEPSVLSLNRRINREATDYVFSDVIFRIFVGEHEDFRPASVRRSVPRRLNIPRQGSFLRQGVLSRMKRAEIVVQTSLSDRTSYEVTKSVIRYTATTFSTMPCLRYLHVALNDGFWIHPDARSAFFNSSQRLGWKFRATPPSGTSLKGLSTMFQFVLEPLSRLYGIDNVDVVGNVEKTYADELAATMMGPKKRAFDEVEYSRVDQEPEWGGKRRRLMGPKRRFFYEPVLKWDMLSDGGPRDRLTEVRTCMLHSRQCGCEDWGS